MTETKRDLDAMLAAARARRDDLPDGLAARILADAATVQAAQTAGSERRLPTRGPGFWAQLRGALGGWPGLGGLATACAAGVWIGLAPPDFLPDPVTLVYQDEADLDVMGGASLSEFLSEDG